MPDLDWRTWWLIGLSVLGVIQCVSCFAMTVSNMVRAEDYARLRHRLQDAEAQVRRAAPW